MYPRPYFTAFPTPLSLHAWCVADAACASRISPHMTKLTKRYALPALAFSAAAALAYCLVPGKSRVVRGQVVIITGGSSGLGLALAHRFGRAGCKLVLASLKEEELDKARQELLQSGDVRDEDDILLVAADSI